MKIYANLGTMTYTQFFYNKTPEGFEYEIPSSTFSQLETGINSIDWGASTEFVLAFTQDPATIKPIQIVKDSLNDDIIYIEESNDIGILRQGLIGGPVHIHSICTIDQTFALADTPQPVCLDTIQHSNEITLTGGNTFNFFSDGIYAISFTGQGRSTGGANQELECWIEINGVGVEWSRSHTTDDNGEGSLLPISSIVEISNGDQLQMIAQVSNSNVIMDFRAPELLIPGTPSATIRILRII